MFDPPPGYADMLGDAATAAFADRYGVLDVPGIGLVSARRPMPNATAALAMAGNVAISDTDRSDYVVMFVRDHLHPDDLERIFMEMALSEAPANSVELIARAVATWGTARPYIAVITLAVMTAHHWRTIRLKLVQSGVHDPMALPTMHILLDATEAAILEAMSTGADGEMKRTVFIDRLYSPLSDPAGISEAPPGFAADDTEDAFDAFAAAAR